MANLPTWRTFLRDNNRPTTISGQPFGTGHHERSEFFREHKRQHPDYGIGFLFNHARFYAGGSAPNVLGDKLASRDDLELSNPVYGYFGYRFFTNIFEETMIKPNLLLKYENGAPLQADINLAASFKNKFELGAGFSTSSSVNLLAGVYLIKNFRLVYHYSQAIKDSPLGNTHGVILSYRFGEGYQID